MQKYRAVIIDDEEDSRSNTRNMIANYCSEVEIVGEAENGPAGKKIIQELKPHVVFLDINMPGMNGFQMNAIFVWFSLQPIANMASPQLKLVQPIIS